MPALQRQTEIDPKTNLYNAKFFAISFEKELERAIQFNRPITLVLGDLDLLRNINNTYGHVAGDVVLTGIAKILRESFRDFDLVARFGGEEFAIMMPGTVPDEAFEIVEAAREKIATTDFVVDTSVQPIKATMSFGICGIQGNRGASLSTMDITNDADAALYNAKLSGRNQTRLYSSNKIDELFNINQIHKPLDESTQEKTPIEARFEAASKPIKSEKTQDLPDKKPTKQAGQFTGPIKTKEPWQVKTYVGFVIAIAVGFAILSFSQFKGQLNISGILIFTLLIILSEIFSIEIYSKDSSVSTAAAFLIAGALMFGPMGALIFSFTIALTAMIKSRAPILRLFFNTGNHFISSSLCIILVSGLYSKFIETPIYMQLIFSMFCGIIVFLSSTFLLTGVIHFSEKRPFFNLWYENFNWLIPYYLAFGVISFALVVGYTFAGLLGLLAIMTPLLILRLSQFQYIDKTKTIVKQLRDANEELKENNLIISEINEDILLSLANTIDLRDSYTLGHSTGVAQIAVLIAKEIGLSSKTTDTIHKSSLLHDIGKIGIPDKILFKPDQLTFEEFEFIKEHPARGARIVEVNASLSELGPIIRHHHERFDGGGYPDGLQGMDIPLEARIICLADSVQAMSSNRPYRKRLEREKVIEEVKINSGTQFDPQITKIFLELLESNRITLGNSEWDEFNTTPNEYLAKYLSKRNA